MLSQFFGGGQHSLRLVWSLLVYQLPSRRFKQSWAWQLKQSSQLPGHQITDGRVGKCGCSSWANHIKKIVFKIDLAWNNKNTQPTVFFLQGKKSLVLEVPLFSALGGSDLRSFGSYAFSGLVTLFFRLENQISSKKGSGHEGGWQSWNLSSQRFRIMPSMVAWHPFFSGMGSNL